MEKHYAGPALKEGITRLKTALLVNNNIVPLNDFTQAYVGNILYAIAGSLGSDAKNVIMRIEPNGIHVFAGDDELVINRDFAKQLIESTIRGTLSPLKGVFWHPNITISVFEKINA